MKMHIVGCGTPRPSSTRFGSSYILEVDDDLLMVDCGPATTYKMALMGLDVTRVSNLFFTHHHFDHNADYPCFLLSRWDQSAGGHDDVRVFGPAPTSELTDRLIGEGGAFSWDWKARVNHPLSQQVYVNRGGVLPRRPPAAQSRDIAPGFQHDDDRWALRAAWADHVQPYLDSLAYRIETAEGRIVFTGDTAPCDSVTDLAKGARTLVCMCLDLEQSITQSGKQDLGVCGTIGAARMAQEAEVEQLVLVHSMPALSTKGVRDRVMEDVMSVYDGKVVLADELTTISV